MPNIEVDASIVNPDSIDDDYIHVVAAVVWRTPEREQFLIAQRQKGKHLADYWEFPGGKVEPPESRQQALGRELREEIGIEPLAAMPFMQVYHRYPERNVLLDTWIVESYRGAVRSRERQALAWIALEQIESYAFPPADIPILEALGRRRFGRG